MLDHELREEGPPDTFDNTMLASECNCPRKLYWFLRRYDAGIRPPYFTFGTAWGVGLNVWHGNPDLKHEVRLFKTIMAAKKVWDDDGAQPRDKKDINNWPNLELMLEQYTERYSEEEPWNQVQPEVGFRHPIKGTLMYYGGAIDDYIDWPGQGPLNREDKTTGEYVNTQPSDTYMAQWDYSSQVYGYQWLLMQILGEAPWGCLMNVASKKNRKAGSEDLRFARALVRFDEYQLDMFMKETIILADRIRRRWDTDGWAWPRLGFRDPRVCVGGLGKSACAYRYLCRLPINPEEVEIDLLKFGLREREKWEPWKREGETEDE